MALLGAAVLRGGEFSRSSMVKRDSETVRRVFKKFSRTTCVCFAADSDRPSVVLVGEDPSFSLERATFSRCHVEYNARVSLTRSAEVDREEGTGGRSFIIVFMRDGCHLEEMRRGGEGATVTLEGADLFLSPNVGTGGLDGGGMIWM